MELDAGSGALDHAGARWRIGRPEPKLERSCLSMLQHAEFELDNTSTACGETGYGLENAGPKMKLRGNCAARLHELGLEPIRRTRWNYDVSAALGAVV